MAGLHLPDPARRRQVEAMAGYGLAEADIARVIGIDARTLRRHYRDELETGRVLANAKVAESLFRRATGDGRQAVTAAIFWLKTRAGWREAARDESGSGDGPVTVTFVTSYEPPPDPLPPGYRSG